MFEKLFRKLRDWWRGYTDEDIKSLTHKLKWENLTVGRSIPITKGEANALKDHHKWL